MEQKTKSLKTLRQRKMLLVLPLLVLPFITTMFWALGGGKQDVKETKVIEKEGFNAELPDPKFKEDATWDKMNYYEQAARDSVKLDELIKKDPNYLSPSFKEDSIASHNDTPLKGNPSIRENTGLNTTAYRDPNEEKVRNKLEALQKAINAPVVQNQDFDKYEKSNETSMHSNDVEKLEEMMQSMNGQKENPDPELQQLSGMLENILDIQHPDRMQEKLRKASEAQRGQVFAIATRTQEDNVSSLQSTHSSSTVLTGQSKHNAFYSFDDPISADNIQNAVQAVIHETQTIVNGSTVKLRLTNDIFINGIKIPKDNFLFGVASLKGERLTITINSLRYNNSLFPVDLSVYDMDGLIGIYIPGAISRDVAKSSADRSMQTLGVSSLDDSWGTQAAGVGIEAAKSLLSKSVKLVKVVVKAGYQVLLRDEKQKDSN
ncbi:conjugative transposon protein TraM [Flavobacterium laiguense]|uniref:Conjugative transposon protein TraM n=1 Tax=Flavobacterium laiguense TaxID=2169409 RepID=A0A2U1K0C2_9FLAO|nr:conjugative transposon protein TraM [Flavobacterium laiguense]PWA10473.1 conjugative transposon protein TraM [Flavobacterium laiguense]